jgi:hypothetical protein
MLKKLYVTYLVPFKTVSVKETEELQRFFDSISETDFQFVDVNKLLQDSVDSTEIHATHMDKRVPIDYTTVGDDLVVVIDFRRFFQDSFSLSDTKHYASTKLRNDNINVAEKLKVDFVKAPLLDNFVTTDEYEAVVSFIRGFDDSIGMIDSIKKIDSNKAVKSSLVGVFDTLSISSADYEYAEVYMNDYITYVNQFIRRFDDAVSFTHRLFKNSGKIVNDTQVIGDSYQAKASAKLLTDQTNALTDKATVQTGLVKLDLLLPVTDVLSRVVNYFRTLTETATTSDKIQKVSVSKPFTDTISQTDSNTLLFGLGTKNDLLFQQPDEDGFITKDTYIDAQYYSADFVESTSVAFKTIHELLRTLDTVTVLPNYGKTESITSFEDGLLKKATFVDAQYFDNDFIESTNAAFKTIYETLTTSDIVSIVPGYGKSDSVTTGDLGGKLLNTSYMDAVYMDANYLGTANSF